MYLSRLCIAGVLTSALWIGGALAGERLEAHRIKTCTPDGVCYPNRQAWGYTPTQWRKWPGAELVAAEKVDQPTKTPAKLPTGPGSGQDTQPSGDLPTDAMEDDIPIPGGDSDIMPSRPDESGPIETQPSLPGDLQKPLQQPLPDTDMRNLFKDDDEGTKPAVPKRSAADAPEEDSTPEMPLDGDDPFKDEPLPGDPNNESGQRPRPLSPTNQRADSMRWRTAPALAVKAAVRESESPEPRLLHSTSTGRSAARTPANAPLNPLRAVSTTVKPKAQRAPKVVPTAEWSAQAEESAAASLWRNNPLRAR